MSAATSLLVRFVHVVGMSLVFGGAAFAWALFSDARSEGTAGSDPTPLAATYEWVFWATMGAMVVTGVGNLGALGPPGPSGRWGTLLTAKLLVVTAFVLGSFVRTLVVLRLRRDHPAGAGRSLLAKSYGATAAALLVLVALAEVLAHG
ncbi:hypothetical protein [Haloferax marisrubri]|uniref:Copper resistance protein D domain-containing protein n=1 Tax=Haloferax marisrubri TaxID=1544719 RepID=A0A2P4NP24_9EURY|nr:hypothetical protein [Haloferax marisrubri]POG54889.1 hypothetical protein AUR65_014305 [Haloferax marisrubri]